MTEPQMPAEKTNVRGIILFSFLILAGCDTREEYNAPLVKTESVTNQSVSPKDSLVLVKPTLRWAQLMSEGNDFYTTENIKDSDILLDKYLRDLSTAKDTMAIWKAVEAVVKGFDKLNLQAGFIETGEREELASFIQRAAEVYGLKYNGDITEKWRMEW